MRILLDTHTFLWFIAGNDQLSRTARSLIENRNNEAFLSIASLWEIAIKVALGKITIAEDLAAVGADVIFDRYGVVRVW